MVNNHNISNQLIMLRIFNTKPLTGNTLTLLKLQYIRDSYYNN